MERILLAAVVVLVAAAVAVVLERRRPEAPTQGSWAVPAQLDRADFARPDAPWLVAVFTSATCDSCAKAVERAQVLASDAVAVDEAEIKARPDLHRRYHIDAVPIVVVADADGVVRTSFTGPPSATDLWAAVAGVREGAATEGGGGVREGAATEGGGGVREGAATEGGGGVREGGQDG